MTDVKCKVQSCHYWGNNDICTADSIMVDNNTASRSGSTRMEAASLDMKSATSGSAVHAHTSYETLCSTFRSKSSEPRH